jgi:hypothetical protein
MSLFATNFAAFGGAFNVTFSIRIAFRNLSWRIAFRPAVECAFSSARDPSVQR